MADLEIHLDSDLLSQARPITPLVVEPQVPVREVFALLVQNNAGSLVVCREGQLEGIFTVRDALRVMADGGNLDDPIETVMTTDPVTISSDETIGAAIRKMSAGGYRRMPLIGPDGSSAGMLKVSGIVRYLVEHFPSAVYNLPPSRPVLDEREGA